MSTRDQLLLVGPMAALCVVAAWFVIAPEIAEARASPASRPAGLLATGESPPDEAEIGRVVLLVVESGTGRDVVPDSVLWSAVGPAELTREGPIRAEPEGEDGCYGFLAPPGEFVLHVGAAGYEPVVDQTVAVEAGELTEVVVELTRRP